MIFGAISKFWPYGIFFFDFARKTHAVHMTKSDRHADKGRNACVAAQRVFVTPVRRNTANYTPRGTVLKGPPGRKNHILTPEERLECFQVYSKWIKEGRKKGESHP